MQEINLDVEVADWNHLDLKPQVHQSKRVRQRHSRSLRKLSKIEIFTLTFDFPEIFSALRMLFFEINSTIVVS